MAIVSWFSMTFKLIKVHFLDRHFQYALLYISSLVSHAGVDFKVKYVNNGGKKLKLGIWDTGNSKHVFMWTAIYLFCKKCGFDTQTRVFVCSNMHLLSSCVYILAELSSVGSSSFHH